MKHLHQYLGHPQAEKLEKLIKNAKKYDDNVKTYLARIKAEFKGCEIDHNRKPRPVVSMPRATSFNEVVTLDLKDYNDPDDEENRYISILISVSFCVFGCPDVTILPPLSCHSAKP